MSSTLCVFMCRGGGCRAVEITHLCKTKICNMMDLMSGLTRLGRWICFSEIREKECVWLE